MHIDVEYFVSVSAIVFGIGMFGVFTRRSPLILLLSVELMLNSCNLTLIAFSRYWGDQSGQVFALIVMGIAASEVVVGLGLVVAVARRKADLDVDRLTALRQLMETLSWLCLFLPLAGVVVLTLAGNRIGREPASWLATAIAFASFICGAAVFFSMLGEGESARSHVYTLYTWAGVDPTCSTCRCRSRSTSCRWSRC